MCFKKSSLYNNIYKAHVILDYGMPPEILANFNKPTSRVYSYAFIENKDKNCHILRIKNQDYICIKIYQCLFS